MQKYVDGWVTSMVLRLEYVRTRLKQLAARLLHKHRTASMGDRGEAAAASVVPQHALPSAPRHAEQFKGALFLAFTHLRGGLSAAEANLGTGCRVAAVSDGVKATLMP